MNPKNKFIGASVAIVVILGFGTLGFKLLTEWTWFESFYFTLITITTIGYTEPSDLTENGRYFGTLLIVVGVGTLGYALSVAVQSVVSLEIVSSLGKRRLMKELHELKDHYIVCGAGRVGRRIGQEIADRDLECVLIETEDKAEPFESDGYLVLKGDATNEEVLKTAGIERARGIVCAVSSDPENLYITLTARDLNRDIYIVSRANEESVIPRLTRAGADKVVSPVITGSKQMAQMLLRPAVADFIELASMADKLDLELEQIQIGPGSKLEGANVKDAAVSTAFDLIVIAVQANSGDVVFNPGSDRALETGDVLIVLGNSDNVSKLLKTANPSGVIHDPHRAHGA